MLAIRWTAPVHLCISSDPAEFQTVMAQIRAVASGKIKTSMMQCDSFADARPYSHCLALLKVQLSGGPTKLSVEGTVLHVSGAGRHLEVLASYFEFDDRCPSGSHNHFEYYDGNEFIAPDSVPLVVMVR